MNTIQAISSTRTPVDLDPDQLDSLRRHLRGKLILQEDSAYEAARSVYNAMIDRHPAVIAHCVDVADVIAAVGFARENGLLTAIRSGGHSAAGLGVCEGGLVIDLAAMRGTRVDPVSHTVRAQAGCTWGDVDHATHAFGLATVSGIISTTGIGGLTLGGGHGHLTRKYGLTIDNVLSVDIVLANGRLVTASANENQDLFWAIRGGGGNFGVATSFLYRLHEVKNIVGGPTLYPIEQAREVLRWYRDFIPQAPLELNGFFAFLVVPPAPPFPEHLHLRNMCGIVWCYAGRENEAERIFKPIREFGPPALYGVHVMPYPALQSAFDALYPPRLQWYWRGDFINEIPDAAIDVHLKYGSQLPTMHSTMHLYPIDGASHRVGRNETAFSYRESRWSQIIAGVDPDPTNADRITGWVMNYFDELHPYSAGGAYVNFMMEEGQERVRATYRENYGRLSEIKSKYDPQDLFCVNQNIRPLPDERHQPVQHK